MDALYEAICDGLKKGFGLSEPETRTTARKSTTVAVPQKKAPAKKVQAVRTNGAASEKAQLSGDGGRYYLKYQGKQWTSRRKRDMLRKAKELKVSVLDISQVTVH